MKQIIYKLTDVNTEEYTGVLMHKPASPKNAKWNKTNVRLSGLLNALIKENNVKGLQLGDTLVDTSFTSHNLSKHYHENPFKLVRFKPNPKSDVPLNYMLRLVNQTKGIKQELIDLYDNKSERWDNKSRIFISKYFVRFQEVNSDVMMKDLEYDVVTP